MSQFFWVYKSEEDLFLTWQHTTKRDVVYVTLGINSDLSHWIVVNVGTKIHNKRTILDSTSYLCPLSFGGLDMTSRYFNFAIYILEIIAEFGYSGVDEGGNVHILHPPSSLNQKCQCATCPKHKRKEKAWKTRQKTNFCPSLAIQRYKLCSD